MKEYYSIDDISRSLYHHGVKGTHWGVRRYQNKDGTLTAAGRKHIEYRNNVYRNKPYTDDVNSIVSSLSKKEKRLLGAEAGKEWIPKDNEDDYISDKAKTIVVKDSKGTPASFAEAWTNKGRTAQIAIATRNGDQYRNKGYAKESLDQLMYWVNRYGNKSIDELEWWAEKNNKGSRKLAEDAGFTLSDNRGYDDYVRYIKKICVDIEKERK